jgi:hypothetical protein
MRVSAKFIGGSLLLSASLYSDFISIDFDMKGLGSLSKMSDNLNEMVEMQKKLEHLPIILIEQNTSKEKKRYLGTYLNEGTKVLEEKYPWLYDVMYYEYLMNEENVEAYAAGSAYFKRLGDLNNDGIDEIYLHSQARCGASICSYRVFQIDVVHKRLKEIFDAYSAYGSEVMSKQTYDGWRSIHTKECWGAAQCKDYDYRYDHKKGFYILFESDEEGSNK